MTAAVLEPPRVFATRGKPYRRIIRLDPCSYCPHAGGTVDHITPRHTTRVASATRVAEGAANLTGACHACNKEKRTTSLLLYLLARLD